MVQDGGERGGGGWRSFIRNLSCGRFHDQHVLSCMFKTINTTSVNGQGKVIVGMSIFESGKKTTIIKSMYCIYYNLFVAMLRKGEGDDAFSGTRSSRKRLQRTPTFLSFKCLVVGLSSLFICTKTSSSSLISPSSTIATLGGRNKDVFIFFLFP